MNIPRLTFLTFILLLGACMDPRPASLPDNLTVSPPAETIAPEVAAFSGIWAGRWGSCLDGKLAVLAIEPDGAVDTVYSWGDCAAYNISAGWTEHKGQITGTTLTLEQFGNGAKASYELKPDGTLAGTYLRDGSTTRGTFVRQ